MKKLKQIVKCKSFLIMTISISLLFCLFAFTGCSSGDNGVAHGVDDSFNFSTLYDESNDITKITISMSFVNSSGSLVKQTIIILEYLFNDVKLGVMSVLSENGASNSAVLGEIKNGENKTLYFHFAVIGKVDAVRKVSEEFKFEAVEANNVSWAQSIITISGTFLGSFLGFVLGIVSNIYLSKRNEKNKMMQVIPKIKEELKLICTSLRTYQEHNGGLFLETPVWKVSTANDNIYLVTKDADFYMKTISIYGKLAALKLLEADLGKGSINNEERIAYIIGLRKGVIEEITQLLPETKGDKHE